MAAIFHDMKFRAWNRRQYIATLFQRQCLIISSPDKQDGHTKLSQSLIDFGETIHCFVAKRRENGALETSVLHLNAVLTLKYFDMFRIEEIGCDSLNDSLCIGQPKNQFTEAGQDRDFVRAWKWHRLDSNGINQDEYTNLCRKIRGKCGCDCPAHREANQVDLFDVQCV